MISYFIISTLLIGNMEAILRLFKDKDVCSLPPATGPCRARFPGFYYDSTTGQCKEFMYGGCRGNRNFFKTLRACEDKCIDEVISTTQSPIHIVSNDFDWHGALEELQRRKALWQSNGITKYLYHVGKFCFCMRCDVAGKYIEIKGGVATIVQFDDDGIKSGCTEADIYKPIEEYYLNINQYFDVAIQHATRGMNAECIDDADNGKWAEAICGGGAKIEYDPVLNYPIRIALSLGPMIADGNIVYTIGCLSVIHVNGQDIIITNYNNQCPGRCKQFGEKCEYTEECCDSNCVDFGDRKECWLEILE